VLHNVAFQIQAQFLRVHIAVVLPGVYFHTYHGKKNA
jgi:hypothetical protein